MSMLRVRLWVVGVTRRCFFTICHRYNGYRDAANAPLSAINKCVMRIKKLVHPVVETHKNRAMPVAWITILVPIRQFRYCRTLAMSKKKTKRYALFVEGVSFVGTGSGEGCSHALRSAVTSLIFFVTRYILLQRKMSTSRKKKKLTVQSILTTSIEQIHHPTEIQVERKICCGSANMQYYKLVAIISR
jgi:hypothetical protein